jgi:hypothetical protein
MAAGTWSATATTSVLLAADAARDSVTLQLITGDPVSIGIGETVAYAGGLSLLAVGDFLQVSGWQARLAINVICDTANSATGSYETAIPTSGREA